MRQRTTRTAGGRQTEQARRGKRTTAWPKSAPSPSKSRDDEASREASRHRRCQWQKRYTQSREEVRVAKGKRDSERRKTWATNRGRTTRLGPSGTSPPEKPTVADSAEAGPAVWGAPIRWDRSE